MADPKAIQTLPETVELAGSETRHRLIVVQAGVDEAMPGGVLKSLLKWQSSDAKVVTVCNGELIPRGDGTAIVTAVHDSGATASAQVIVKDFDSSHRWSFRNDVESILARQGCRMGACHGALAGKGVFRPSLRGYDPHSDWQTITREARGRRIELADLGRSLLLAKPTGALPLKRPRCHCRFSHSMENHSRWIPLH